jgi:hypothetical protein
VRTLRPLFVGFVIVATAACSNQPLSSDNMPDLASPADLATHDLATSDLAIPPDMTQPDLALCAPESDIVFCARLQKSCETVNGTDNCGHARSAVCGTCSGAKSACLANVCVAPACASSFSASGTPVSSVSVTGVQEALLGASANGDSLLFLRAPANACVGTNTTLLLADPIAPGVGQYTSRDLTSLPNLGGFARTEETMTLTADGLGIVGAMSSFNGFQISTRSAVGATDFGAAVPGPFAQLNAALPTATWIGWPVLSTDGLAFYYHVTGAGDPSLDGNYESLRSSTSVPFPAGTLLPALVQAWDGVSGISPDRLALFVTKNFGTAMLTRSSLSQPFAAPVGGSPPGSAYRVVPIAGCDTLIGTCEPGGCLNEDICVWTAQ